MVSVDEQMAINIAKSLMANADSPEMIEYAKNNTSTDLSPTMRLTLHKILGWHPPYDDTRSSFLDCINSTYPKYYDGFAKLLDDIECHENLIPLIDDMILEGLNPKNNNANEFAQRWGKILYDARAKGNQGRPKGESDYTKKRDKKLRARAKELGYKADMDYGKAKPIMAQLVKETEGLNSIDSVKNILNRK